MSYYNQKRTVRHKRPQYGSPKRSSRNGPKKAYINPSKFIKAAQPLSETHFEPEHSFADFNLHPIIYKNLLAMGYESPSPIQDKTIPAGLRGKNIVGIANTGTGKTAAF